ncbi:MAG: DUF5309 domain-containing protein [Opitutaceae bacterium]|jgi:hypothetical protein|nr:DUF5309 domain-containing protein [Opitutaceae bacterium]
MPKMMESDAVAKRQDLSNKIHLADQKKCVFLTAVPKGPAPENSLGEWPVDTMPEARIQGTKEGKDVVEADFENLGSPAAVLQGRLMEVRRVPAVSKWVQNATNQAGIGRKQAWAKAYARGLVMLNRDIEITCLGDQDSALAPTTTGSLTRGIGKWISNAAQGDLPVPAAFRTPEAQIYTGAIDDINDDVITDFMRSYFDSTGNEDTDLMLLLGSKLQTAFSRLTWRSKADAEFVPVRQYNVSNATRITRKVDLLETDFGTIVLRLSSFINKEGDPKTDESRRLGYALNMRSIMVRFADGPGGKELPDLGGGPRALVSAMFRLEPGDPRVLGKFDPTEPEPDGNA